MAPKQPELIFVSGPQSGERGRLTSAVVIIGRSPQCGIQVIEKSVSREQIRFELTYDGWVLENISSHPIKINGKKYRAKKKVILDTGDVISLGLETVILYVSPGDDPEAALSAYREAHAAAATPTLQTTDEDPSQPETNDEAAKEEDTSRIVPAPVAEEAQPTEVIVDELDAAAQTKKRKYIIGFGIYAVVMVIGIVAIANFRNKESALVGSGGKLAKLSDVQIEEAIGADLKIRKIVGPAGQTAAEDALNKAISFYYGSADRTGDLYRAIKHFKMYQAYRGSEAFDNTAHHKMFLDAKDELTQQVKRIYRNAWISEQRKDWRVARDLFEELVHMLPVREEPHAQNKHVIFDNVWNHLTYVRKKIPKRRR